MSPPANRTLLRSRFKKAASMFWFAAGMAVGLCAWKWGTLPVTAWALKIVTGYGATLVLPLGAAIILAIVARALNGRAGSLAYGDFLNLQPWLLSQLLRAASAFFGVVVVAVLCWRVTGSTSALISALLSLVLGSGLAYSWVGIVSITNDLAIRREIP